MKFFTENKQHIILDEQGDCLLDDNLNTERISIASYLKEEQLFVSTFDRLLFSSPIEIAAKVLQANGYLLNLENILACFDQMRIGISTEHLAKGTLQTKVKIEKFQPTLLFNMPNKSKVGTSLTMLYQEIEAYEMELAKLRGNKPRDIKATEQKTYDELKEENTKLKNELQVYSEKIFELNSRLQQMQKEQKYAAQAIDSGQLLPPQMRLGKVKGVNFETRQIEVKIGRKSIQVSFDWVHELPHLEDACIIKLDDGKVEGVYFYESKGEPFTKSVGKVLYATSLKLKIRDENRTCFIFSANNSNEEEKFSKFKRGDLIVLEKVNQQVVRFDFCNNLANPMYSQKIQEEIATHQIITSVTEMEKEEQEIPSKNKKKEVA